MTAPKPESTSAVYRRCAAAVEKAIKAIQENPSLYRGRTARNKLVELAAAAKQLDRLLDGNGSDDEDHFGEALGRRRFGHEGRGRRRSPACAAAADDDAETPVTAAGDVEPTPVAVSRPPDANEKKKTKHKSKKQRAREKKRARAPPRRRRSSRPAARSRRRRRSWSSEGFGERRRPSPPCPRTPRCSSPAARRPGVAASSR